MSEISDWSTTAGSNNSAAPNGWPEGMAPSDVNNSAREGMAVLARFYGDINGSLTSGGSSNAYTLTPNRTISAYAQGLFFVFVANFTNTGAATLNVSTVGATTIKKYNDQDLESGDIESGQVCYVVHDGTYWQLISTPATVAPLTGGTMTGELILDSGAPSSNYTAGFRRLPPASITSGTPVAADSGCCVYATGNVTFPNSVFSKSDVISVYAGGSSRTLTQGSGVTMRKHGSSTTGNLTLAAYGLASVLYVSASECVVIGDVT